MVKDLLENHRFLFEIKDHEIEQEKKMEAARKRIERLNSSCRNSMVEKFAVFFNPLLLGLLDQTVAIRTYNSVLILMGLKGLMEFIV